MGEKVSILKLPWYVKAHHCPYSEAWRYTGPFTRYNRFKGALPGLGTATVAFAVYCTYEYFFLNDSHLGHGDEHNGEKH